MGRETDETSPLQEQDKQEPSLRAEAPEEQPTPASAVPEPDDELPEVDLDEGTADAEKTDDSGATAFQGTELTFDDLDDIDWLEPVPAERHADDEIDDVDFVDIDEESDEPETETDDRQMSLF